MTVPSEPGPDRAQNQPYEPMPSAPPPSHVDEPSSRPKPVDTAFLLWMIVVGIQLVSLIFAVTMGKDELTESVQAGLEQRNQQVTEQELDDLVNAGIVLGTIIALLFSGLFVLLAYLMRRGRNWARITLAVLGALSVVFTLLGLSSADPLNLVVSLVGVGLIVGAAYLMFSPEANPYFASRPPR